MPFQYKTNDSLLKVKFKVIFSNFGLVLYTRVDYPIADTSNMYICPIMHTINKSILAASSVIFKMDEFSMFGYIMSFLGLHCKETQFPIGFL